jgi:hypothetical protein
MWEVSGKLMQPKFTGKWLTSRSIEDNIVITKSGSENLTTVVKTVEDMERIINSS